MIGQTRAEFLKIRSTRTTLGLVLGLVALVLLIVLLTGLLSDALYSQGNQRDLLLIGTIATIFAAIAGILVVTNEFRFGTIRPTFLFTPRRSRVVIAKVVATMVAGAMLAIVGEGLSFGIGRVLLSSRNIPFALNGGDEARMLLGGLAGVAVWGVIGVGLALILRNHIASVIGLLVWVFVVENLLFGFVPGVGRFTPGRATDALIGQSDRHLLPVAAGGAVLVAWAVALVALGLVLTARRDVN